MQGRDGGPPEVVRVCGCVGGEDGGFVGGVRCLCWREKKEEKGLQEREREWENDDVIVHCGGISWRRRSGRSCSWQC